MNLQSYTPGLFLAGFGMLIIISTLIISAISKTSTIDTPVFMDWPIGMQQSVHAPNVSESERKAALKQATKILDEIQTARKKGE